MVDVVAKERETQDMYNHAMASLDTAMMDTLTIKERLEVLDMAVNNAETSCQALDVRQISMPDAMALYQKTAFWSVLQRGLVSIPGGIARTVQNMFWKGKSGVAWSVVYGILGLIALATPWPYLAPVLGFPLLGWVGIAANKARRAVVDAVTRILQDEVRRLAQADGLEITAPPQLPPPAPEDT